jgi:hypothetical protein
MPPSAGREGTVWYYGALAEAFGRLMPGPLSAELGDTVSRMRRNSLAPTK